MSYQPRYNPIHQSLLQVKMIAGVEIRFVVPRFIVSPNCWETDKVCALWQRH